MSRVLVVDDENSIRVTLCEFLKKEGFDAECSCDALTALQMLEEAEYDVILTDIIMPRFSGMDLLAKIREKNQSVQIIIMTGEPTVETAVKAVRSGANDYLSKPINRESLIRTVRQAVRVKTLHDEKVILERQNLLYQKNLEEIVQQRTEALHSAMRSIISLLSSVVEVRDPYTAGHQRRVGNLAAAIAEKMNLSPKTIDMLRVVGYIHDIGKIMIPAEILSKPGKLSTLEMKLVREHSFSGYEMLKKVDLPEYIADTIYQHHERCDGSGYPQGLKAEDITEEARIIIVADVVEAMMSHRPYRPALGIDAALCEIERGAGTLYDPKVVAACVELFTKDGYVIDDVEHKTIFPL